MALSLWQKVARIVLVIFNNLYCIPSYLVWTFLLRPLFYFRQDWYDAIEGILYSWLLHFVAFWTWNAGCSLVETGDDLSDCIDSKCLLIVNHQSTGDVPVIMQVLTDAHKSQPSRRVCWILDDMFKYSNFGLPCHVHGDFFILQGRQTRNTELARLADHLRNVYLKRGRTWIVLFPEGGFLCNRKESSQVYGRKHGYPHLEHVTLPRIGVTQTILDELSADVGDYVVKNCQQTTPNVLDRKETTNLKYVVDVTIGYMNGRPFDLVWNIITGDIEPCQTVVHYRKYAAASVPRDEAALTRWLYQRFAEKDRLLDEFYRTGQFPGHCANGNVMTAQDGKHCNVMHSVSFSPSVCLLMHAFYIVSAYFHLKFAIYIYYAFWSFFV